MADAETEGPSDEKKDEKAIREGQDRREEAVRAEDQQPDKGRR